MHAEIIELLLTGSCTHLKGRVPDGLTEVRSVEEVHTSLIDALESPHDVHDDGLSVITVVEAIDCLPECHRQRIIVSKVLLLRGQPSDLSGSLGSVHAHQHSEDDNGPPASAHKPIPRAVEELL